MNSQQGQHAKDNPGRTNQKNGRQAVAAESINGGTARVGREDNLDVFGQHCPALDQQGDAKDNGCNRNQQLRVYACQSEHSQYDGGDPTNCIREPAIGGTFARELARFV